MTLYHIIEVHVEQGRNRAGAGWRELCIKVHVEQGLCIKVHGEAYSLLY